MCNYKIKMNYTQMSSSVLPINVVEKTTDEKKLLKKRPLKKVVQSKV